MTAFGRVSHRKVDNFEPPPIPGETGSPSNAFVHVLNEQVAGGFTYHRHARPRCSKSASACRAPRPARSLPASAARRCSSCTASPACRPIRASPAVSPSRASPAGRRGDGRTATRSSRIRRCSIRASTTRGSRAARASRPATSTRRSTRRSTTSTRSTGATPTAGSSAVRRRAAADPATYNLADFMFGAAQLVLDHQPVHRQPAPADALRATCRTTSRSTERLTLNLGLRYEFATPQWEKDNFLTNFDPATNTLIQAKDGSIYDRALVNPDRNNFAPRLGAGLRRSTSKTVVRAGYGISYIHFNRMGGENLLSFNGPHVVGAEHHAADRRRGCASATRRRRPASGRRSRAIPRAEHAGELQPAERARELHPAGHADRQRAELARLGAARDPAATCSSTSATSATRAATS